MITDGAQDPTMSDDDKDDSTNLSGLFVADHWQLRIAGTRIIVDKKELSAALMPGAIAEGVWKTYELTQSGTIVRDEIKANNPHYND